MQCALRAARLAPTWPKRSWTNTQPFKTPLSLERFEISDQWATMIVHFSRARHFCCIPSHSFAARACSPLRVLHESPPGKYWCLSSRRSSWARSYLTCLGPDPQISKLMNSCSTGSHKQTRQAGLAQPKHVYEHWHRRRWGGYEHQCMKDVYFRHRHHSMPSWVLPQMLTPVRTV